MFADILPKAKARACGAHSIIEMPHGLTGLPPKHAKGLYEVG
jgi:hypothetical protein